MFTQKNAKTMAKSLRDSLVDRNVSLSHSTCLEIVARQFGFADWNTLSAKLPAPGGLEIPLNEVETCLEKDGASQMTRAAAPWSTCSFCGKSRNEVRSLVGGCGGGRLFARAADRRGVTFSSAMNAPR
jgi:Glyoxalase superfamily protein/ClpX C4-type zinc finger